MCRAVVAAADVPYACRIGPASRAVSRSCVAQTRSFCYVDDLIEALIRLMNTPDYLTGPVNIGNTNGFTILELAQRVVALAGSALKTPHRDGTTTSPKANLTRFHGVFAPPHALRGSIVLSI